MHFSTLRLTRRFWRVAALVCLGGSLTSGLIAALDTPTREIETKVLTPATAQCDIAPLEPIRDSVASAFEVGSGGEGAVNIKGLTPRTARALVRFERIVAKAGGKLILTSGYRPKAYQDHLQLVWDKWMHELRLRSDEACLPLKTQIAEEFEHHHLLESQRPVPLSDHTLGIGFDAAYVLPPAPRTRRGKRPTVTIDRLARLCGLKRPAPARDPVHFRLA